MKATAAIAFVRGIALVDVGSFLFFVSLRFRRWFRFFLRLAFVSSGFNGRGTSGRRAVFHWGIFFLRAEAALKLEFLHFLNNYSNLVADNTEVFKVEFYCREIFKLEFELITNFFNGFCVRTGRFGVVKILHQVFNDAFELRFGEGG